MTYQCRLRHRTNEQLREMQISLGIALDMTYEATDPQRGLRRRNIQRRLWRVMDEQDKRRRREGGNHD